jgi:hypothetical protein
MGKDVSRKNGGLRSWCKTCLAAKRRESRVWKRFWLFDDPNAPDKYCVSCKTRKPKTDFREEAGRRDGYYPYCIECQRFKNRVESMSAERLEKHRAATNQRAKRRKDADPRLYKIKSMLRTAKCRAPGRGYEFLITEDHLGDWRHIEYCPVFAWIKLDWNREGEPGDDSPTIDRINSDLGYVPGNVRIISWRANSLRKDGTATEFAYLLKDASRHSETERLAG